ncbi:MAG: hypothetical protein WC777_03370 [Candidatus Gracilibacteria bacterium]|jgi:hypothetical protein
MSIDDEPVKRSAHEKVVLGLAKIIKMHSESSDAATLLNVAREHPEDTILTDILVDFASTGVTNLSPDETSAIVNGDYSDLWIAANHILGKFGYAEQNPTDISI